MHNEACFRLSLWTISQTAFSKQALLSSQHNIALQRQALWVGVLLMAIKFAAWQQTNSNAIFTDALESIINVLAGVFTLYSLILAAKPRDLNHPYGHGKIEFISAGFEGGMVLLAGVAIVGKAGYNLFFTHTVQQLDVGIGLIAVTGAVNFVYGHLLVRQGQRSHSLALVAGGEHLKTDAWSTLALMVGLGLVWYTGYAQLDNIVAIAFGGFIVYTGFGLLRRAVAGIMDEADLSLISDMVAQLEQRRAKEWIDIHNLRVIKYGTTLHIDCHLTLPWYFDIRRGHDEVKALEQLVSDISPQPVELFIHVDPCDAASCRVCQQADCPVRQQAFASRVRWTMENVMEDKPH